MSRVIQTHTFSQYPQLKHNPTSMAVLYSKGVVSVVLLTIYSTVPGGFFFSILFLLQPSPEGARIYQAAENRKILYTFYFIVQLNVLKVGSMF